MRLCYILYIHYIYYILYTTPIITYYIQALVYVYTCIYISIHHLTKGITHLPYIHLSIYMYIYTHYLYINTLYTITIHTVHLVNQINIIIVIIITPTIIIIIIIIYM